MVDYVVNKSELVYAQKTYKSGDTIPVASKDVRVLMAIGAIREGRREDRVQVPREPQLAPTPTAPATAASDPVPDAEPVEPVEPVEVAANVDNEFQVETTKVPDEILAEEDNQANEAIEAATNRTNRYRTRRMRPSEDE